MNVFVLCTGRNGSVTFIKACKHMNNFTAAHESRSSLIFEERLDFPKNHIEADNRLVWFLGRLDKKYGQEAFYVHLLRNREKVAASYNKRWFKVNSIIRAYTQGVLMNEEKGMNYCLDYVDTVTENIEYFLEDKPKKMTIHLESIMDDYKIFWEIIDAKGDLQAALNEFSTAANATTQLNQTKSKIAYYKHKIQRVLRDLPFFLKNT